MPINISNDLPAKQILDRENVFIMDETRAVSQDIRPLHIAILNLMPRKIQTETQLLRLLGNTPLQIDVELLQTATYTPKNSNPEHLLKFYKTFDEVRDRKFDGLIITGAPVEQKPFEEVSYWPELCEIMEWSKRNVFSTFHICWGAQAGLYYHYNVQKHPLKKKAFGVFAHNLVNKSHPILYGFDDLFFVPHSRHTTVLREEIEVHSELTVLSESVQAGIYLVASEEYNQFFITGHSEYDADTLAQEYFRDLEKGAEIDLPHNYFPEGNPENAPPMKWKAHSNLLFSNWLNYFVYQKTPFDFVG